MECVSQLVLSQICCVCVMMMFWIYNWMWYETSCMHQFSNYFYIITILKSISLPLRYFTCGSWLWWSIMGSRRRLWRHWDKGCSEDEEGSSLAWARYRKYSDSFLLVKLFSPTGSCVKTCHVLFSWILVFYVICTLS